MIAFTTLALLIVGILSSFRVGIKKDRLLSFCVFFLLGGVFTQFCLEMFSGNEDVFSFIWNSSPSGDIKIDIISNKYHYNLVLPFFIITIFAVAQNLIFRYEERRGLYNATLIFNLVALIVMMTSNNFVQLLCALFVIDILAMFIIKDTSACRRYILLNITADMLIFMVLAIINCQIDSLDIREILLYKQVGRHLDFIALAGLTSVFMKMGFWGFHIGLLALKNVRLHRLLNILFLSSPVSALILLIKFHVLWNASTLFAPYIHLGCVTSIFGGFIGSLITDNFKQKIIYWQMMFWAIFVEILCFSGFVWSAANVWLLLQFNVLMWCLYLVYYQGMRQNSVILLMQQNFKNSKISYIVFTLITLMIAAISGSLDGVYNRGNRYYIWYFAVLFVLSLSTALRQILFTPRKINPLANRHNPVHLMSLFALTMLTIFILQPHNLYTIVVFGWTFVFILFCMYSPLWRLRFVYKQEYIQNNDFIGQFYKYAFVKPLRLIGRFLWLLIDHLFIEQIIIGFCLSAAQRGLRFFRQLHKNTTLGGTIIVILIGLMLWFSYIMGGKL